MKVRHTVEIWHDYVCPLSYIAAYRVSRFIEDEGLDLSIRFLPWPLEKVNGAVPRPEDEDVIIRELRALEPHAFPGWTGSSSVWPASALPLHAAYEAAVFQDIDVAARFDLLLRRSIFADPQRIDTFDALCSLAVQAGLDLPLFRELLVSGAAERRVQRLINDAAERNITAIPTLVFESGRIAVNPGLALQWHGNDLSITSNPDELRVLLQDADGASRRGRMRTA